MNKEDINRLVDTLHGLGLNLREPKLEDFLTHFAVVVAEAEREECARVCDRKVDAEYATGKVDHNEMAWTRSCAIDIRARGKA